jgi:hypothetical protein
VPFKNIASFLLTENPSRSEEHSTDPKGLTSKPQGSTRRIIICIKKCTDPDPQWLFNLQKERLINDVRYQE